MRILLTNDDGFHAPGLVTLSKALAELGEVQVVAPAVEQSGKSHSITYLEPLFVREEKDEAHSGWVVNGTPADCTKLAITQLCDPRPDLVISGINHGLNAGINVLYSGTVAAAVEGAFFGIPSVAISLEYNDHPNWKSATRIGMEVITRLLADNRLIQSRLFNVNIPTHATQHGAETRFVPMARQHYGEHFLRRLDPKGRPYFWATGDPPPRPTDFYSDLSALDEGFIAVTPLTFDLTDYNQLGALNEPATGSDWQAVVERD